MSRGRSTAIGTITLNSLAYLNVSGEELFNAVRLTKGYFPLKQVLHPYILDQISSGTGVSDRGVGE